MDSRCYSVRDPIQLNMNSKQKKEREREKVRGNKNKGKRKETSPQINVVRNFNGLAGQKMKRANPKQLELAEQLRDYTIQFMAPSETVAPRVCPSTYPSQVCSRHIHKVFDISSNTHPAGFTVAMMPNLNQPGFVSSGNPVAIPSTGPGSLVADLIVKTNGTSTAESVTGMIKATQGSPDALGVNGVIVQDSFAEPRMALQFDLPVNQIIQISIVQTAGSINPCPIWYKTGIGAWNVFGFTEKLVPPVAGLEPTVAGSPWFLGFGAGPGTGTYKVSIRAPEALFSSSAVAALAPGFEQVILDLEVGYGRLVSMSCLATNTSPSLADGGTISVARVPYHFSPFTDVSQNISRLPENRRYQSSAKNGGHVTWMPAQYDEFEVNALPKLAESLSEAEYLLIHVSGWGGGANISSFRLQFDWIVEFYTPNQLFEKVLTPPMTKEFETLYHIMLSMDAATCNPDHLENLKGYLKEGVNTGKDVVKWVGDNADSLLSILSLVAAIL